LGI
jgi:hypothetical protein